MPIKVPDDLPAKDILTKENIFIMNESRAYTQDIRPLKILILNLMPLKQMTETQLLRMLGNTPLQIDVTLLRPFSYRPKNTSPKHLETFYKTLDEVKSRRFDGMIVTGAPVETLLFEKVDYWEELASIFEWSKTNVTSTMHICWGAQAAMYHHYGIEKYRMPEKVFGVFEHNTLRRDFSLMRGFDDIFLAPHSRYTETRKEDIEAVEELVVLAESDEVGVYIAASRDGKNIFVLGHSEYDRETLLQEYERDRNLQLNVREPKHYFMEKDGISSPLLTWRAHSNLLFTNWLNYYVYQETPYTFA